MTDAVPGLILILMVFALAYTLGRRAGIKQGHQLGFVQAVIDLRIKALEHGVCPICHYGHDNKKTAGTAFGNGE